jgi:regulator of protease activity HflC (stomatin/prohibitin superfamily)
MKRHIKEMRRQELHAGIFRLVRRARNLRRHLPNLLLAALGIGLWTSLDTLPAGWHVPAQAGAGLCFLLAALLRIAFEWERALVFRLGRFHRVKGPGPFLILPVLEQIEDCVDGRIRVTDFEAEKVLTRDAVPVFVDAVIYWMVWDARKAVLEVEHYPYAVSMTAKTALRDIIGRNPLTRLLADRDGIGRQLQKILDEKMNPWGITSLAVGIKDIILPKELEDAMSREAQAEREKKARLIIAGAEEEASAAWVRAAATLAKQPDALRLRALNLLGEAVQKEGSMILMPSDVPGLADTARAVGIAKAENRAAAQPRRVSPKTPGAKGPAKGGKK